MTSQEKVPAALADGPFRLAVGPGTPTPFVRLAWSAEDTFNRGLGLFPGQEAVLAVPPVGDVISGASPVQLAGTFGRGYHAQAAGLDDASRVLHETDAERLVRPLTYLSSYLTVQRTGFVSTGQGLVDAWDRFDPRSPSGGAALLNAIGSSVDAAEGLIVRVQSTVQEVAEYIDPTTLPSILTQPPDYDSANRGDRPTVGYRASLPGRIARVPPEGGDTGYGNIPDSDEDAAIMRVLNDIYGHNQGVPSQGTAFIGDYPDDLHPQTLYGAHAVASLLPRLRQGTTDVRAVVLTDFFADSQPAIRRYLDSQGEQDDRDLLRRALTETSVPFRIRPPVWQDGLIEMIETARQQRMDVIAGRPADGAGGFEQQLSQTLSRVTAETGGNAIFYGSRYHTDHRTEAVGLVGIDMYSPLFDRGFNAGQATPHPLRIDQGAVQYYIWSRHPDVPSGPALHDMGHNGDRASYLWNPFRTGS